MVVFFNLRLHAMIIVLSSFVNLIISVCTLTSYASIPYLVAIFPHLSPFLGLCLRVFEIKVFEIIHGPCHVSPLVPCCCVLLPCWKLLLVFFPACSTFPQSLSVSYILRFIIFLPLPSGSLILLPYSSIWSTVLLGSLRTVSSCKHAAVATF